MTIIHILLLFVVTIFAITPAHAQSPFKGGMKYTAARKAPSAAPAQPTTIEQGENTNESAADRVWKKYKSLAAGQEKQDEAPEKDANIESAKPALAEKPQPQATGFAGILQKYQQNKQKRGGLQSMTVKKPTRPSMPKVNME